MKKNILPHLNLLSNKVNILKSQMPSSESKRKPESQLVINNSKKQKIDVEEACCSQNISKTTESVAGQVNHKETQTSSFIDKETQTKSSLSSSELLSISKCCQIVVFDTGTKSDSTLFEPYSSSTDVSPLIQKILQYDNLSAKNIESNSRLYSGLPEKDYYLLKMITGDVDISYKHILITLKKIRLNYAYKIIAIEFGLSAYNIARIICNVLPKLAHFFHNFIYWPDKYTIESRRSTQFAIRYRQVQSVITCLEIEIQTPIDAIRQAQTWSNYKKCNTIKYLLSTTPYGFINFISRGYAGRTTDADIVEQSGFLVVLPDNSHIMADRGFKNTSNLLTIKNSKLVMLPSTPSGNNMIENEVRESKRIAALRTLIQRVRRRLREFKILLPNACIDTKLIPWLDDIIIIACGIINVQNY